MNSYIENSAYFQKNAKLPQKEGEQSIIVSDVVGIPYFSLRKSLIKDPPPPKDNPPPSEQDGDGAVRRSSRLNPDLDGGGKPSDSSLSQSGLKGNKTNSEGPLKKRKNANNDGPPKKKPRIQVYKNCAEDFILAYKTNPVTIDLTGVDDEKEEPRSSKPFGFTEAWAVEQLTIIKILRLLQVRLEFADDIDLMPKPRLWMEWYDEMADKESLEGGDTESLQCWRAIMTLILLQGIHDDNLKSIVFALFDAELFTPDAIQGCTMASLTSFLQENAEKAQELKKATGLILE